MTSLEGSSAEGVGDDEVQAQHDLVDLDVAEAMGGGDCLPQLDIVADLAG